MSRDQLPPSKEVARQIKAATDPLTEQLERLCDLKKELRPVSPKRNEKTTGLIQGPSRLHSKSFDSRCFDEKRMPDFYNVVFSSASQLKDQL